MKGDTIAAQATPLGQGGVGIIRLSGPGSAAILAGLFRPLRPSFSGFRPFTLHHGHVLDAAGRLLDEVLAVLMPGPGTYTGEDVAEIHCHGGRAVCAAVLEEAVRRGARLAGPGEFTLRAFLNGRMDLTQAEAVAEVISAPSTSALHLAQAKLSGELGRRIGRLRAKLENLRARLCLAVDFPEEDVECLPPDELRRELQNVLADMDGLLAAVLRTRAWREGARVVMLGAVNAGKSSLLNALLGRNRAIVTATPGTTRDYIEEYLDLSGLTVRLTDTAGLRDASDAVELAGLEMARRMAAEADLVLLVLDLSAPLPEDVRDVAAGLQPQRVLVAANKADLDEAAPSPLSLLPGLEALRVSAKTGEGLAALAQRIRWRIAAQSAEPQDGEVAPNLRQAAALEKARADTAGMLDDAAAGATYDVLGVRLEGACACLAEITGEMAAQDVLNRIFENFCIGK